MQLWEYRDPVPIQNAAVLTDEDETVFEKLTCANGIDPNLSLGRVFERSQRNDTDED